MMPVGVISDSIAIAIGGIIGSVLKARVSEELKTKLNSVFGISALAMGIMSIFLMKNMPAVIFSMIIGTTFGIALKLEKHLTNLGSQVMNRLSRSTGTSSDTNISQLVTATILFCASGTGIYGSMISGISGDNSVLYAKTILDFFTALIFACTLGNAVSLISLPQCVIYTVLYLTAALLMPFISESMLGDFKACGGIIMLATGFRLLKLKELPLTDMLPAMILVLQVSSLWSNCITELIS